MSFYFLILAGFICLLSSCRKSREDIEVSSPPTSAEAQDSANIEEDDLLDRIGVSKEDLENARRETGEISQTSEPEEPIKYYTLTFMHNSLCLQIADDSIESQANIIQATCSGKASQQFSFIKAKDEDYYFLKNLNSTLCVTVSELSETPGVNIFQFTCIENLDLQKFSIEERSDGYKIFKNKFSRNCLDNDLSNPELNNVIQWICHEEPNQRILVEEI